MFLRVSTAALWLDNVRCDRFLRVDRRSGCAVKLRPQGLVSVVQRSILMAGLCTSTKSFSWTCVLNVARMMSASLLNI